MAPFLGPLSGSDYWNIDDRCYFQTIRKLYSLLSFRYQVGFLVKLLQDIFSFLNFLSRSGLTLDDGPLLSWC